MSESEGYPSVGTVEIEEMRGDNLGTMLATFFDDDSVPQDSPLRGEHGFTTETVATCNKLFDAINTHYEGLYVPICEKFKEQRDTMRDRFQRSAELLDRVLNVPRDEFEIFRGSHIALWHAYCERKTELATANDERRDLGVLVSLLLRQVRKTEPENACAHAGERYLASCGMALTEKDADTLDEVAGVIADVQMREITEKTEEMRAKAEELELPDAMIVVVGMGSSSEPDDEPDEKPEGELH